MTKTLGPHKDEHSPYPDPFEILGLWFEMASGSEKARKKLLRLFVESHARIVGDLVYDTMAYIFEDDTPPRKFSEIRVGDVEETFVKLYKYHIVYFGRASGDFGAPHFDPVYASGTHFKEPIAHGVWLLGLVSKLLAHRLPGRGTIFRGIDNVRFDAPVFIGDVLKIKLTVKEVDQQSMRIVVAYAITNHDDKVVSTGECIVYPAEKLAKKS